MTLNRREFMSAAAAMGAALACAGPARATRTNWRERRDLFPEGVASGDPAPDGVILWTRRPFDTGETATLTVEIAEDEAFRRVVATAPATVSAASDWTCRVLAAGLRPARVYWYRFTDADGNGSRVGRTITAPAEDDPRPVSFAFVSCQSVNEGYQHAWRRMIHEDSRRPRAEQLGFVLHLGDFIYEVVQYPDEVPTRLDRRIVEVVRLQNSERIGNFHIPLDLAGYRAIYRAYLHDPDIQDARAHWPFVAIWDNHEFSWQGWQSVVKAASVERQAPTIKVAANQAWFEYLPARIAKPSGPGLDRFDPPQVADAPVTQYDDNGLGLEPNNLAAIDSLVAYRALRYGRHLDLMITDQYSYKMRHPLNRSEAEALGDLPRPLSSFVPEELMELLDAGRTYNNGNPPDTISFAGRTSPNYRKAEAPFTMLGARQKQWFLDRLRQSRATWKIWGNSLGTLDNRADPQNLPEGLTDRWPGAGYSNATPDWSTAFHERAEIYDLVRSAGITGFAIVSGDRHSFWAGYAAKSLPPKSFDPVGLAFVTGSISSPGMVEGLERMRADHPLRALFVVDRPGQERPAPTVNMMMRHGVRSCLEYARSGDQAAARALSNPDLAPHLAFVDMGGHGYATVHLSARALRTEFVCIPRPKAQEPRRDGGPVRYRIAHRASLWRAGEAPRLEQSVIEGDPGLSI
jgi:alkaline phosphatase D